MHSDEPKPITDDQAVALETAVGLIAAGIAEAERSMPVQPGDPICAQFRNAALMALDKLDDYGATVDVGEGPAVEGEEPAPKRGRSKK